MLFLKCFFVHLFLKRKKNRRNETFRDVAFQRNEALREAVKRIWTRPNFSRENDFVINSAPAPTLREGCVCFIRGSHRLRSQASPPRTRFWGCMPNQTHCTWSPASLNLGRPIRRRNVRDWLEYSLLFAGFECHVVVSREKWLPAGRRAFCTRGRERRTRNNGGELKRLKNRSKHLFIDFCVSADGVKRLNLAHKRLWFELPAVFMFDICTFVGVTTVTERVI